MRALIQRVLNAEVWVEGKCISSITEGMLILLGIEAEDTIDDINWLSGKVSRMRIFNDENGNMNNALNPDLHQIIVVSQFTLHASTKKGNRPSFIKAAKPDQAKSQYEVFIDQLKSQSGCEVSTGVFGAHMEVKLTNDGPVTIWIDSKNRE